MFSRPFIPLTPIPFSLSCTFIYSFFRLGHLDSFQIKVQHVLFFSFGSVRAALVPSGNAHLILSFSSLTLNTFTTGTPGSRAFHALHVLASVPSLIRSGIYSIRDSQGAEQGNLSSELFLLARCLLDLSACDNLKDLRRCKAAGVEQEPPPARLKRVQLLYTPPGGRGGTSGCDREPEEHETTCPLPKVRPIPPATNITHLHRLGV